MWVISKETTDFTIGYNHRSADSLRLVECIRDSQHHSLVAVCSIDIRAYLKLPTDFNLKFWSRKTAWIAKSDLGVEFFVKAVLDLLVD